jgi:hypothetical protein
MKYYAAIRSRLAGLAVLGLCLVLGSGCVTGDPDAVYGTYNYGYPDETRSGIHGAAAGAALGAGAGAIIGHQSDEIGEGAAVGAAVGATTGYIYGRTSSRNRRRQMEHMGDNIHFWNQRASQKRRTQPGSTWNYELYRNPAK